MFTNFMKEFEEMQERNRQMRARVEAGMRSVTEEMKQMEFDHERFEREWEEEHRRFEQISKEIDEAHARFNKDFEENRRLIEEENARVSTAEILRRNNELFVQQVQQQQVHDFMNWSMSIL